MSTVDSQLLSAASIVVRDIVRPLRGKDLTPQMERMIGRVTTSILLVILVVMSLTPFGQSGIILLASKGTGIALLLLVPLYGALFWDRSSAFGAAAALLAGGILMFLMESGLADFSLPYGFGAPIAALLLQIPVFVMGSLIVPSESQVKT